MTKVATKKAKNNPLRGAKPIEIVIERRTPETILREWEEREILEEIARTLLTPRQFQVISRRMNLDGEGCGSQRAVSEELGISKKQVAAHEKLSIAMIREHYAQAFGKIERRRFNEYAERSRHLAS